MSGRILYVGGKFTQVAPRTGPILALSAASGASIPRFPAPSGGVVATIVPDGTGGWFVGGSFARIGGVACANLAHVTAAMTVDRRFCPRPNDAVDALALDGRTLYAGGAFMRIGGARRAFLAALSPSTGHATTWAPPTIDDVVDGIAERNGVLYLLGAFNVVGGKNRFSLAAVDIRTRKTTTWDPKAPTFGVHGDTSTNAIAAGPNAIYVGGIFDHIGGKKVPGLAALDPASGRARGFAPQGKPWSIDALALAGGRLYAGGVTHTGGYLAAYDAASGKAVWPSAIAPGDVRSLAVGSSRLFAGGDRLQAFDATNGHLATWAPAQPNQPVTALAVSGKTVVAGGSFTGLGGVMRDGLAAVDLATGRPTSWDPGVSKRDDLPPEIDAIAPSGSTVYLGGDFDHIGGKPRADIAAVSAASGKVTGWAPQISTDQVLAVALGGPNVYLGGFDVASSYDTSGKLRWNSPPGGISASVNAVVVAGGTVYLGGSFDVIGGATRHALVGVDARNGSTLSWNPDISESDGTEEVHALARSGSTLYVAGSFDSARGVKRKGLAAFDVKSGKLTAWRPKPGDVIDVYALAATPKAVYAGGDGGAKAFDPKTGATLAWHPSLTVAIGGFYPTPFVHALAVAGSTVYVGDEAGLEAVSR